MLEGIIWALFLREEETGHGRKELVMNTGEKYKTSFDLAKKYGFWGLVQTAVDPNSNYNCISPRIVEGSFLAASEAFDDESAINLFTVLMRAIEDTHQISFVKNRNGQWVISGDIHAETAYLQARNKQTKKAMELFGKLPKKSEILGTGGRIELALPKTKIAILTEIASWWRSTGDEEEADEILNFLKDNLPDLEFPKFQENFLDVIRKATNKEFPPKRLMRHFVFLILVGVPAYFRKYDSIAIILKTAWARNSDLEKIAQIFQDHTHNYN